VGNSTTIGRFAPSPSGPLHLGSLMSATCSYLQAKAQHGKWLVRIEDVDTPRVVKGMADKQLQQLENFGLHWDDDVLYQSKRFNDYHDIVNHLIQLDKVYACECSRKQLKLSAQKSPIGLIYPQTCLNLKLPNKDHSLRFKASQHDITFEDAVYGHQNYNIQQLSSDWVLKRLDGIYAYHLAVIADDHHQGITDVVRGVDILPLTPLHIDLQQTLKFKTPKYWHHPLIVENGQKLSKQNHAQEVSLSEKIKTLNLILKALGQLEVKTDCIDEFWNYAIKQWDETKIPSKNFEILLL